MYQRLPRCVPYIDQKYKYITESTEDCIKHVKIVQSKVYHVTVCNGTMYLLDFNTSIHLPRSRWVQVESVTQLNPTTGCHVCGTGF